MDYFTTVTSKGTVSIPVKVRNALGIRPGMSLRFQLNEKTGNAEIVKPVNIDDLRKRTAAHLKAHGIKPMTDEELDKAIDRASAEAAVERYKRSLPNG